MIFNENVELNSCVPLDRGNSRIKPGSPSVKVWKAMMEGKDLSELNARIKDETGSAVDVDACADWIRDLAYQASAGNQHAVAELNDLRMFNIEPLLLEELKLLQWMGTYQNLPFGTTAYARVRKIAGGDKSRFQAPNGDVTFPVNDYDQYAITPVTISGGYQIDYRKIQAGDMTDEAIGQEQVRIDIRNNANRYVIYTIYDSVANSPNVTFKGSGAGLTKTALDTILSKVRRFGQANIFGDYNIVSQINGFAGYHGVTPSVTGVSEAAMEEIRKNGLLGMYNGAVVQEIKNAFNVTKPLSTGDGFELYFPDNLLFVIPSGSQSPVRTWTFGGLKSLQAPDIATGRILTRFDLTIAADVGRTEEYKVGLFVDTTNPVVNPRG